jgi:D-alanyl-D-alanine carboxypeptidase/D-alanyl-D-alanine-endopeptidase (penicillin-binding protein 4)
LIRSATLCAGVLAVTLVAAPPVETSSGAKDAVRELRANLAKVFSAPIMARGVWAVEVRSLDTGERLYELNSGKLMMPASNMKVVTLATAAETLGWDYRFTTTLETAAPVENGVLLGDLFIRGSGDPTLNTRQNRAAAVLAEWVGFLRAAGIHEIRGRIVGDDRAFDDEGLGDGWSWDYLQFGYAAPVGALQFNEDVAPLTIAPGARPGDPVAVTLAPGSGLEVVNRATTGAEETAETIDFRRQLFRPSLEITGSMPAGGSPITRNVSVVNPTIYFAQSVKDALVAAGIRVSGEAVDLDDIVLENGPGASEPALSERRESKGESTGHRRALGTTTSPPLSEIASVLMKVSQNLYAETFVKALAASAGEVGTTAGGRRLMRKTLTAWGIPEDAYVISDGSGLSRYNYVSAGMITTILERMYRDPRHREEFAATLPIAGKDGTIASRMRRTLAEGNATAKTGSIANVRSLSGYVRTREGETLVFSIIANDFIIPAATVNWIADLAVEILAAFTRR